MRKFLLLLVLSFMVMVGSASAAVEDWVVVPVGDTYSADGGNGDGFAFAYADDGFMIAMMEADSTRPFGYGPDSYSCWGFAWAATEYYFYYTGEGSPTPIEVTVSVDCFGLVDVEGRAYMTGLGGITDCDAECQSDWSSSGIDSFAYQEADGACNHYSTGTGDCDGLWWPEDGYDISDPDIVNATGYFKAAQDYNTSEEQSNTFIITSTGWAFDVELWATGESEISTNTPYGYGNSNARTYQQISVSVSIAEPSE